MDVAHRLRDEGYRLTPQRKLVWDVLRRADHHLTAEEIHRQVVTEAPDFNLTSVYRTLSLLAQLGMVTEVRLGGGRGHWEVAHADEEFHLVCDVCGRVEHHRGTLVSGIRTHLGESHGFTATDVELVVHGECERCRAR